MVRLGQRSGPAGALHLRRHLERVRLCQRARRRKAAEPPVQARAAADASQWQLDPQKFPLLSQLGRNLTLDAFEGRIDPVVGREREIEQVLDVLARRRANNPILVGPPGVGKTAIAEGLALRLLEETTQGMRGRLLIEVSAGGLVSGTSGAGRCREIARLRSEVKAGEGRVLLVLDELHALVGGNEGPDDLPRAQGGAARGELRAWAPPRSSSIAASSSAMRPSTSLPAHRGGRAVARRDPTS